MITHPVSVRLPRSYFERCLDRPVRNRGVAPVRRSWSLRSIITMILVAAILIVSSGCQLQPVPAAGGTAVTTMSPARILDFANRGVALLAGDGAANPGLLRTIAAASPKAIDPAKLEAVLQGLAAARANLATLSAATSPAMTASTLDTVDLYINAALDLVGGVVGTVAPQYQPLILAVTVSAQLIEQFVRASAPVTARLATARAANKPTGGMSTEEAARQLGVRQ